MKKTFVLKENITGREIPEFYTKVDVTLTDTHLTFEFDCKNTKYYSHCEGYNTDIWYGDVCEAYICTDGTGINYYEIEVTHNNSNYVALVHNPDGNYQSTFVEENPLTSSVEKCGENDYKVKFSLPLEKINYDKEKGILLNIFRIETEGGISDKNLLSANPTLTDTFHKPGYLFKL